MKPSSQSKASIMVSVSCITYNHAKYIRDTLDGFLIQKANFKFEVLINDDASTDGTADIIREYEKKHPHIIKPIYQKENQYSKGVRGMSRRFNYPRARGKYIALCEGDDYWTDPNKLQQQVSFMEKNPGYTLTFHRAKVIYEGGEKEEFVYPDIEGSAWYNPKNLLSVNYIPTNSVVYRRLDYSQMATGVMPGDWYWHLYHARFGKIKFFDKVMSVYRKHKGGIWWDYDVDQTNIWRKYGIQHLRMHDEVLKLYVGNPTYKKIIFDNIDRLIRSFIAIDRKQNAELVERAMKAYPEYVERAFFGLLAELESEIRRKNKEKKALLEASRQTEGQLKELVGKLERELAAINSSRLWRLRNAIVRHRKKTAE
jgi:glycosyltransferase involved in cell wall biosynthesis